MELQARKPNPTDVSDDEWAIVAPSLALIRPDAPRRCHDPRAAKRPPPCTVSCACPAGGWSSAPSPGGAGLVA